MLQEAEAAQKQFVQLRREHEALQNSIRSQVSTCSRQAAEWGSAGRPQSQQRRTAHPNLHLCTSMQDWSALLAACFSAWLMNSLSSLVLWCRFCACMQELVQQNELHLLQGQLDVVQQAHAEKSRALEAAHSRS